MIINNLPEPKFEEFMEGFRVMLFNEKNLG